MFQLLFFNVAKQDEETIVNLKTQIDKEKHMTHNLQLELHNPERKTEEEKHIVDLEGELSQIRGELAAKDKLLQKQEQDKMILEKARDDIQRMMEVNNLKMQQQHDEDIDKKNDEIKRLNNTIESFQEEREQLDHLKRSLEIVATDMRSKDSEIKQLNSQLKTEQETNNELLVQREQFTAKMIEKDKEIAKIRSEMEYTIKSSKEKQLTTKMEKMKVEIDQLTKELNMKKKANRELKKDFDTLKLDYEYANKKIKSLNTDLQMREASLHSIKQDLNSVMKENNSVKLIINEKEQLSSKLKQTMEELINLKKESAEISMNFRDASIYIYINFIIFIAKQLKIAQDEIKRKDEQLQKYRGTTDQSKLLSSKRESQATMKILELNKVISDYKSQVISKTNELEKWQRDRMNYAKEIEDYSIYIIIIKFILF